jgi:hypothetical protein
MLRVLPPMLRPYLNTTFEVFAAPFQGVRKANTMVQYHCQSHGLIVSAPLRIDRIAYSRFQAPAFSRRMETSLQTSLNLG